jgi:hypothetical protein
MDILANVLEIATFVVVSVTFLFSLVEKRKLNQPVRIRLVLQESPEGLSLELPLHMKRKDLSRAELLGRLGMLPMRESGSRFSIRSLASIQFLTVLETGVKTGVITIPATREEIDQFDLGMGEDGGLK